MLHTRIPALDEGLEAHAAALGRDATAYRNHAYRVANLGLAFASDTGETRDKLGLAAAFHDLGIWTDGTFDYLEPSIRLACEHLARSGREEWAPEITAMIREHHKITAYRADRAPAGWLVEPFRRADWVDVTRGLRRFGLPRSLLAALYRQWPSAGFHRRLVELELRRLRTHPWSPLPMLRW